METKDIIHRINLLNSTIEELEEFLSLIEKSNIESGYGDKKTPKLNEFEYLYISSYIWTGSQNPRYEKKIRDRETINVLADVMKSVLRLKLSEYKSELRSLITSK